ncbi:MAG: VWA domain-containing protein [Hyphomicrobium sp.]
MIDMLAAFHFLRPWWLLLVIPAIGLWWLQRRAADGRAGWRAVMDSSLLEALTVSGDGRNRFGPADLLLAGWFLAIAAVSGPTLRQVPSPFAQASRPAMFVVKVTPSMQGRDLAPTRLDRARQKISDLLTLREGAPTGLIAYAGSAHLVMPPTPDASVVSAMANALAPDVMPRQGDALGDAVKLAQETLAEAKQGGSIVVFADAAPVLSARPEGEAPVTLFAMLPAEQAIADPALRDAARTLGADLLAPTIDTSDVDALAKRLANAGPPPASRGESPRWEESGLWLVPLIVLLVLYWFRRGWVLA